MRVIHDIHGGIHPPERKELSRPGVLDQVALPPLLVLPLRQHLGAPAQPIVSLGDRVLAGEKLAEPQGLVSVPIHAPTSGTVRAIELRPIAHASGLEDLCIVLEPDGEDRWVTLSGAGDWRQCDPADLLLSLIHI